MTRGFSCELYVPSLDKNLRFNEIKIKHLKNIIKHIQNSDDNGLCDYFDDLLINVSLNYDTQKLDRLDKFYILLGLRTISIGPILELSFKCDKTDNNFLYKMDLINFLRKLSNIKGTHSNNKIVIDNNMTVNLGYPRKFHYVQNEDILTDCISSLIINNKKFDINQIDEMEQEQIMNLLPNFIINKIDNFLMKKQQIFDGMLFLDVKSPFDSTASTNEMPVNVINNSLLEILKIVYRMNIDEIYSLIYMMCTKLGYDGSYVENSMTFAEAMIYVNKYVKEIKDREEQMKKQPNTASAGGIPLPLSIPFNGIE